MLCGTLHRFCQICPKGQQWSQPGVISFRIRTLEKSIKIVKVKVGNDQEFAQPERNSHSKNRGGKNEVNNKVVVRLSVMRKVIIIS